MSLKFGKIKIESMFNMRNICKAWPIKFKMADLRPLPIDKFSHLVDSLNMFRSKIYTIYCSSELKIWQDSDRK